MKLSCTCTVEALAARLMRSRGSRTSTPAPRQPKISSSPMSTLTLEKTEMPMELSVSLSALSSPWPPSRRMPLIRTSSLGPTSPVPPIMNSRFGKVAVNSRGPRGNASR
jgi:hypothetical protein